jgi:uncharacterized protein involved in type VI secretion and phage assembly
MAVSAAGPTADGVGGRYFGIYPAIVNDLSDPNGTQRVQVSFPWLGTGGRDVRAWARLVSPYADDDQGFFVLPEVDTEVIVAFEAGELTRPYIIGAAWNGSEAMPESPDAANNLRLIQTRAKTRLEFDDTQGSPKVTLKMDCGHKITLDDSADTVRIEAKNGAKIEITMGGGITIQANTKVDVTAPLMNVDAPMAKFTGVVKCETLIASTGVVSPSYTPGAGTVW